MGVDNSVVWYVDRGVGDKLGKGIVGGVGIDAGIDRYFGGGVGSGDGDVE